MKTTNPKLISPIGAASVNTLLALIDVLLVKKIPYPEVQDSIRLIMSPIKKMITVLSDVDPNNKEQVQKVWTEFVQSGEFNASLEARIMQAVDLIQDPKAKAFVSKIVKPCIKTIQCLYDQDPNNVEQIRQTWIDFAADMDNIKSIIQVFVPDESLQDDILLLIENLFENFKALLNK